MSVIALWAFSLSACSRDGASQVIATRPKDAAQTKAASQPLIISAAASTKEVVESLAEQFKADTGTEVKVNPGASSGLANQIIADAPADLFLSASQQWADEVDKHNKAAAMVRLLDNTLVIAVPAANPGGINEPKDLLSPAVKKIALAGEKVPAGTYADQALRKLELLEPLTAAGKIARGQDVRSALSYVERGEAEAGIVYSTDLSAATGLKAVYEFDSALHDEIVYVLVLLKHGISNRQARGFYEYLQSPAANATYAKFGFARLH